MSSSTPPTGTTTIVSSSTCPSVVSRQSLARLLVGFTLMTVLVNVLFLSPLQDIPVHENPYFFSRDNHGLDRPILFGRGGGGDRQSRNETITTTTSSSSSSSFTKTIDYSSVTDEQGKQYIEDIFREAGVELTDSMRAELPTWRQVQDVVGSHPYVLGLESSCTEYQKKVPPLERMIGSSGMFNTGTNLVTHLLKQNCEIPERREKMGPKQSKESYGMRWQVPWGKHTPAKFRLAHATQKASDINKEYILPVVTIRHPYSWFKSMCKNHYTAKWDHGKTHHCPNLKTTDGKEEWNPLTVTYADNREDEHRSLAHLWNDWYSYYVSEADFPFVVVRMEDLVFYPKETTRLICECAGGKIRTDQERFQFIVDSAKADSPGHDKSTGIFAAWVKYSKRPEPRFGFSRLDYDAAREVLDEKLMDSLGYSHPPAD